MTDFKGLLTIPIRQSFLDELERLSETSRGPIDRVNVLRRQPTRSENFARSGFGTRDVIWPGEAVGPMEVENLGGKMRFTERITSTVDVEVIGSDSSHDQDVVDNRLNEIIFEILDVIASWETWTDRTKWDGLFDWWTVLPGSVALTNERLEGVTTAAARATVGLLVEGRRGYR